MSDAVVPSHDRRGPQQSPAARAVHAAPRAVHAARARASTADDGAASAYDGGRRTAVRADDTAGRAGREDPGHAAEADGGYDGDGAGDAEERVDHSYRALPAFEGSSRSRRGAQSGGEA